MTNDTAPMAVQGQDDPEQGTAEALSGRSNEEDIRLATGFTDIFSAVVLIGLFSFISALASLAFGWLGGLIIAAIAWFLVPYFVVKRRFAATAILLSLAFGLGVFIATSNFMPTGKLKILAAFAAAGALWVFWKQYKIPISAALALGFATLGPLVVFFGNGGPLSFFEGPKSFNIMIIVIGFILFGSAIYWDISDRERVTRRSDVAFWLHLVAGPLMVHGMFTLLGVGFLQNSGGLSSEAVIWPIFLLGGIFALISVVIDRRPLLLASFGYLVFAIGVLVYRQFIDDAAAVQNLPIALMAATMISGVIMVVLAGSWSQLRSLFLSFLPEHISQRLTPVEEWRLPLERNLNMPEAEKEPLRLVHGLNDYMAAIGMGTLFLGSLLGGYVLATQLIAFDIGKANEFHPAMLGIRFWAMILIPMIILCGLAAFFVRWRRMALTAVVAALQFFLLSVAAVILFTAQQNLGAANIGGPSHSGSEFSAMPVVIGCILAAGANFAFWRYNMIPISFALGFAMLFPFLFPEWLFSSDGRVGDDFMTTYMVRSLIFGLLAFAVAIYWDRSDKERKTQRTDIAFWMHVLASLHVIPALYYIVGDIGDSAILKLLVFVFLVAVALFIDRRAMLLVALPVVIGAIAINGDAFGFLGAIGVFGSLTLLNLYWDEARAKFLPTPVKVE